jgi:aspartyl-tRNA(Asn)/glutamyl-tRNA(Gln) amidotransferase subunit B
VERIRATLPELPDAKLERFMADYGLSRYDSGLLTSERAVADYYEACASNLKPQISNFKTVANWMTGELFRLMNESGLDIEQVKVRPTDLAALIEMVDAHQVNLNTAKLVFEEMFATGEPPAAIVQRKGLSQVSDADGWQYRTCADQNQQVVEY